MLGLKFPKRAGTGADGVRSRRTHLLLVGPKHPDGVIHNAGGIETGIRDMLSHFGQPEYSQDLKLAFLSNWNGTPITNRWQMDPVKIRFIVRMYLSFGWILVRSLIAGERVQSCQIHTSRGSGFVKDSLMVPLAKLFGARVVLSIHGYAMEEYFANLRGAFRAYTKLIFRFSDGFRTLADSVGVALHEELGVPSRKTTTYPTAWRPIGSLWPRAKQMAPSSSCLLAEREP
jgi:hypothetical protein